MSENSEKFTRFKSAEEAWEYLTYLGCQKTSRKENGAVVYNYDFLDFSADGEWHAIYCTDIHKKSVLSERKFKLENYSDYYYGGVVRNLEGLVHIFEKFFHADEEGWYEKMLKKVKLRHLKECQDFLKKYGPLSQIEVMQKVYRVINPFLNHDFDSEKFIEDTIFNSTEVYTAKSDSGFCIKDSIIFEWKRIIDGDSKIECYLKRDIFSDSYVITINDKENKKEIVHNIYREINKEEIVLRLTNNYHDGITLVRYPEGMICYKKWHKSEKPRLLNEEEQKGFEDLIISNFIKKE